MSIYNTNIEPLFQSASFDDIGSVGDKFRVENPPTKTPDTSVHSTEGGRQGEEIIQTPSGGMSR